MKTRSTSPFVESYSAFLTLLRTRCERTNDISFRIHITWKNLCWPIFIHSLKGLVKEWFHVLRLAHQFHAFEYHNIHDMVLGILDKALESMPVESIDDAGQAVLDKRKVDIEELHDSPFGKLQHAPHPNVSPSSQRQKSVPYSPPSSPTPVPAPKRPRTLKGRKK